MRKNAKHVITSPNETIAWNLLDVVRGVILKFIEFFVIGFVHVPSSCLLLKKKSEIVVSLPVIQVH